MFSLLGGVFLGWSLGANDASNIFGTAVSTRMVKFWTAAVVAAIFVIFGAFLSGQAGIQTLEDLTSYNLEQAVISSISAAITVSLMTFLKLPVSTSQSVVGSIVGIGILNQEINLNSLGKVFACWVGTPIGAAIMAVLLYGILSFLFNRLPLNLFKSDIFLRAGLLLVGAYGAYALGANNVANVSAVFVGAGLLNVLQATLIGGGSIALGIMTFSKPVMETVGKRLVSLDPFCGLTVVLSLAVTMHAYASLGVPVSSSQAVIGGVLGIGLIKGMNTISKRTLLNIFSGWLLSPLISCLLSLVIYFSLHLKYIPPIP